MNPGDWSRLTDLFDRACQQSASTRDAWLRTHCPDPAMRVEIDAMLRAFDSDPAFLETPIDPARAIEAIDARLGRTAPGSRLGPYRIVREIGRGGMGVVYEAARDDAEFERRVAIKVLPAAWSASALVERFRFERRVLAGLDHPSIARLLDGGTTEDGVPYYVMEYVDGRPIDAWCHERRLTVRQRVALLRAVCDAVEHAHQQLVVHRDLKPANILMTDEGVPKLLDFGIATLLSEEGGTSLGLTRTGQGSFTPEYASPEQVRGERVSTATDVYSLGVLAYRLLAGRPPYELKARDGQPLPPLEIARTICDVDPPPPSRVAPAADAAAVRGDLDTIVLKALRKDPRERYTAVLSLAADLAAWMDGRIVSATPPTWGYRVRKFAARNRGGVAAAAAIALAVVGGGITTAWQARIAAIERDKAERRFAQVRDFSRSLLFEVHESLRGVPGATESRRLLLDRAVQFLDGLATDAGGDVQLTLELAQGYRRLGQVQGSTVTDNLGDTGAAAISLGKAVRLMEEVMAARPDLPQAFDVATGALDDLASALRDQGRPDEADRAFARHQQLVERMERSPLAAAPEVRRSLAESYVNMGRYRSSRHERDAARVLYDRAIALYAGLPPELQARDEVARGHAVALKRAGALLLAEQRYDEGERLYRQALALDERVVARNPDNATYRYDLTFSLSDLAFAARRRGDPAAARELYSRALDIRLAALEADPKNARVVQGVANLYGYIAACERDLRLFSDQIAHRREQIRLADRLLEVRGQRDSRIFHLWTTVYLAQALMDKAETERGPGHQPLMDEAALHLRHAEPAIREVTRQPDADTGLQVLFDTEHARLARLR